MAVHYIPLLTLILIRKPCDLKEWVVLSLGISFGQDIQNNMANKKYQKGRSNEKREWYDLESMLITVSGTDYWVKIWGPFIHGELEFQADALAPPLIQLIWCRSTQVQEWCGQCGGHGDPFSWSGSYLLRSCCFLSTEIIIILENVQILSRHYIVILCLHYVNISKVKLNYD